MRIWSMILRLLQRARDFIKRVWHSSHKNKYPNNATTKPTNTSFLTSFVSKYKSKHIAKIASKIATFSINFATKISRFLSKFLRDFLRVFLQNAIMQQTLHKFTQTKIHTSRFFTHIFSHIITPFLAKHLAKFLASISKTLSTLKHSAYKIPFIKKATQATSAFANTHCRHYKRKISLKSARLIKNIKTSKHTAHYITLCFYALCGVFALFSMFLLGVRYGVESLLDSALPNAKKSSLFGSFIDSSLAKSNLTIIPKEYLASLQNQQDFATQEKTPQDNAPKDTQQESKPKSPPQMPKIDENKYVFYGNYSFSHALNLAKNAILERDFVRARIWIYKAWDIQEYSQTAWELYLQSYEEDAGASNEARQEAKILFDYAKAYYGF